MRRLARTLLLGVVPVFLISTLLVFLMTHLATANPAAAKLGESATAADVARLNAIWGLDQPFLEQYASWLGNAVTGDLGRSWFSDLPVADSVAERLPVNLSIAAVAIATALLVGFAGGIVSAVRRGGPTDRAVSLTASAMTTIPEFWLGILFVVLFAVTLGWLPSGGWVPLSEDPWQWLRHMLLPGASLGVVYGAQVARQLRGSLIAELESDYVVGARVRGLSPRRILFVHALRNAAPPAVAAIGIAVPALLGGAVIAETIFGLPGLGQLALSGAQQHDVPVIQGVLVVSIVLVLISNQLVDVVIGRLRPAARRR